MEKYIGLDAHSSTCRFCVTDERGREIDEAEVATNGRLLVSYVKSIEGKKKLTFEESEISRWLYGLLNDKVDELIVCNPVHNRQYKKAKTDKLDARQLAKLLRGGFLSGVYHNGSEREKLRSLMSGYEDLTMDGVRLKNRYKSLFRKSGQKVESQRLYSDESFLEGLERPDEKFIGSQLYAMLDQLEESRNLYAEQIHKAAKSFKEMKFLKTIPGIGEIQAAKIVSQVVDPKRFPNKYKYFSYCGLVRHPKESGGKSYGTIKIMGNRTLKTVYKMAGRVALRGTSGLRKLYDHLRAKGVSDSNAYNAVCRKIAAVSLSLWRHQRKYNDQIITGGLA